MIKTKYFKYTLILFTVVNICVGQKKLIDSLQKRVAVTKQNEKNYALYNAELAEALRFSNNKKSIYFIEIALSSSIDDEDYLLKSKLFCIASNIYRNADDFLKMDNFTEKAIYYANKTNDNNAKALAYYVKSLGLIVLNDDKRIKALFEALKYAEKSHNNALISKCYYYIYGDYAEVENLKLEDKYARLCLKFAKKSNDPDAIAFAWQAMGTSFNDQFIKTKNKKLVDSISICFRKGIKIFNQKKDYIINQSQLSILQLNLANHFYMNVLPMPNDSIKKYTNLALNESIKTDEQGVEANCYGLLSQLAYENNDLTEVERLLKMGISNVENRKNSRPAMLTFVMLYSDLSALYKKKGNFKLALAYSEKSFEVYQKSINEEQIKSTQILDAKYELRKKTEQIKLLDEKNKLANKQKYLYFGIFAALLLSLLFMFLSYNYRLKFSIQKEKLSESNAKLKTEEAARLLVEQDLILVQKQQMQKELLAGALQVDHKNDLLKNMKQKLVSENLDSKVLQKMNRIINEESRLDNQFNEIKNEFKDINPEFFQKLQEKSKTKLSNLDLKYCAYIKLNLPTKQMATLLNVEPSTIRMNKYRLKQKLELMKDEDLYNYLNLIN